jgi:glutamate-1-semialdehyde 2,1-aminomutase
MSRTMTEAVFAKSCKVIPGGVNSPARSFQGLGLTPLIVKSGKGALLQDVDGKEYIDYCCSWGASILGHAAPEVNRAAIQQIEKGSSYGILTESEERLASLIQEALPSIDKIRFVSSGTEAVMTALRIARGFTGRTKIVKFIGHYHGHSDALLVQAGSGLTSLAASSSKGVTKGAIEDTLCLPFNDPLALMECFRIYGNEIAAVIVEPIAGNMGVVPPEEGFLALLRNETRRAKALLIFDEVITGFRVGWGGAQGLYKIEPDLTCLGKVIGGGFPAAAVGGRGEILDCLAPIGPVYQAGTLSGNPVAMEAGRATLLELKKGDVYLELETKSQRLVDPILERLQKKGCCQRIGSMMTLFLGREKVMRKEALDLPLFARFFRHLFERGIYIPPSPYEAWFVSRAHTDKQIDFTVEVILDFLRCQDF